MIIDYQNSRRQKKRRIVRWFVWLFLISISLLAMVEIYSHRQRILNAIEDQSIQRQCMQFSRPPTMIAYEENQADGPQLAATDSNYIMRKDDFMGFTSWTYDDPPWHQLAGRLGTWNPVSNMLGYSPIFLHERISPGGNHRLVAVFVDATPVGFIYRVLKPAPPFGTLIRADVTSPLHDLQLLARNFPEDAKRPLTIYEGQPDDKDGSHFTIEYKIEKQHGLIDGSLQDDETIRFSVRYGPDKL